MPPISSTPSKFAQFIDDAMRRLRIEFGAVGLFQAGHVARVFDGGALHAEANPKERNVMFAGVLNGVHHALNSALAESAGNQNAVVPAQARCGGFRGIDFLRFDPLENGFVLVRQSAVE